MRRALTEATFVAQHRRAFGKPLIEHALMARQLAKMTLATEQARSMVFQTAQVLQASDQGEPGGYALARIMTPLIKFRACRDARKVTGDAMEVRGGCGYIEEWSDARLLRDAHLGSIWEGTSNIVALDVLRAIQREASLPLLRRRVDDLLNQSNGPAANAAGVAPVSDAMRTTVERVFERAAEVAANQHFALARQTASALYHVTTMAALRWEAVGAGLPHRALLAEQVLRHKLLPRDPLTDA
jgi:acyl-CoA dehydrogenase